MGTAGVTTAGGWERGLGPGLGAGAELLGQEALGIGTLPRGAPCPLVSPPGVTPRVQGRCWGGSKGRGVASGRL